MWNIWSGRALWYNKCTKEEVHNFFFLYIILLETEPENDSYMIAVDKKRVCQKNAD